MTAWDQLYAAALADSQLSRNLTAFQSGWRAGRDAQFESLGFEDLRAAMKAAKTDAIDHLDDYLATFTAHAERSGSHVHIATDAAHANRIILDIARQHGATRIAKSKSMVSEEIHLNAALADHGIEAIETDLGEWLVQQRGETPSHMVMPAIHLARQQTGATIAAHTGRDVPPDDVGAQVAMARDVIRSEFFAAQIGITGANALIAESGTVMMVTNEGNGRLTASVPPVHIVLAGIEKIVPTYDDAITNLRLLARSATAQAMTVYSTFIQGPSPGQEQHIVLLDNGRRAMRDRPEFREALHCIRCAACANVCPPYRDVGGHVFGHIYTGAIGLVVTPFFHGIDAVAGPQSLCLSCNACETVCPVGIPLPRQILDVRAMVVRKRGMKRAKRVALTAFRNRTIANLAFRIGRVVQRPLVGRDGLIRARSLPPLRSQTRWRSLPSIAAPIVTTQPAVRIPSAAAGMTVALFPGCMTDRLYPRQRAATERILAALGVDVVVSDNRHCCGLIPNNSGDPTTARPMAIQTMDVLESIEADIIVSPSASCVAMMVQDYIHLFRHDPPNRQRAERLAARVMDLTTFLVTIANMPDGALSSDRPRTVTYHDSCQGANALGLRDEPRHLIEHVLGDRLVEMVESSTCCGFGGAFSIEQPALSERIAQRKLAHAAATSAEIIVTDNQGCIMHMRGVLNAAGSSMRVMHIAELIDERLGEG